MQLLETMGRFGEQVVFVHAEIPETSQSGVAAQSESP